MEEEAENIEMNQKIEEMKRVCSVATLQQSKLMILERLTDTAREIGVKRSVEHILGFVIPKVLKKEKDSIKQALLQQFTPLCKYLTKSKEGYKQCLEQLLPHFQDLLQDPSIDLSKAACDSFLELETLFQQDDKMAHFLPIILDLAQDQEEEDCRCLSLKLMSYFASRIDKTYVEKILVTQFLALAEDMVLNVRRNTVQHLVSICKEVPTHAFEKKLLPVYFRLSRDTIWGVRKAAVEILPEIAEITNEELRGRDLVELYKIFAKDNSKWVKWAAFQYLGPFIATLKREQIDQSLLEHYIGMGDPRNGATNSENSYHCAYNFPAVLLTLGAESWVDLKRLYFMLVHDQQWKVRRTLSYSLHEIAKVLGPELAQKELVDVLEAFLKDSNDVREGVLKNLSKFMATLKPEHREQCLKMLVMIQSEPNDWRLRHLLASQIPDYVPLLQPGEIYQSLYPIIITLSRQDIVFEVRQVANQNLYYVLKVLEEEPTIFEGVRAEIIESMAQGKKFSQRQAFSQLCLKMLQEDETIFLRHFAEDFETIAGD